MIGFALVELMRQRSARLDRVSERIASVPETRPAWHWSGKDGRR
jgi:hypothetical protein